MKELLVVVDMQNDFINGSLGTKEAQDIVKPVCQKNQGFPRRCNLHKRYSWRELP